MDNPTLATLISAAISGVVGLLTWRLSVRVQQTAVERQAKIDNGQFIEEQRTFDRELREWLRKELEVRDYECDQRVSRLEAGWQRWRNGAVIRERYWRGRALGHLTADDTPPPELYGET